MRYRWITLALLVGALALVAAGCGGDDGGGGAEGSEDVTGTVSMMAIWSGTEQENFMAVIDAFEELYPNVTVNYTSGGDNLAPLLSTAVQGGNPPDIACIAQPGLMADFVSQGALESIDDLHEDIVDNFGEAVADVGSIDGTQYAVMWKASNKATIWYNVADYEEAGVDPPETWDDLNDVASTLKSAGITPYSVGVDVGWPITDLFENVYLRTAGADMYDQLAKHEIPWTDQSVKDALMVMQDVVGESDNMVGGTSGAVLTDMPASVANVFSDDPKGAMVIIGDFAPAQGEFTLEPVTGYNVFPFPSIDDSPPVAIGSGDLCVNFRQSEAATAFLRYLTTPEAAEIMIARGGFTSPNKKVDMAAYVDEIARATAEGLTDAETYRFDLSDLQPSAFGGTPGQGLFKAFTDFVKTPNDIDSITQQMEADAQKAFSS